VLFRSLGGDEDTLLFNYAQNATAYNSADGGTGIDTVRLEFKASQWANSAIQADVAAFKAFLATSGAALGETFTFAVLGLDATNFENVRVFVDGNEVVV
jgi:hypothetical protein